MKKILFFLVLTIIALTPVLAQGQLVKCGNDKPCGFADICPAIKGAIKIFEGIAAAAAVLFLTIGGIVILVSAGNPELKNLGKKILITTIIGTILAIGASEIVSFILTSLGSKYGVTC